MTASKYFGSHMESLPIHPVLVHLMQAIDNGLRATEIYIRDKKGEGGEKINLWVGKGWGNHI
jgi:hypothetical protein